MSFSLDFPKEPGNVGLLCQSGGNAIYLIRSGAARGLRFSKGISYGNACDVNECDILECLADDPETKVIAAYIEGISDGRRFADVLARAVSAKPVVIYKGGYTEAGSRATASHTGAMAGSQAAWDGLIRQAGAIRVNSMEEVADTLVALVHVKPPRGLNACVVGIGGGASVLATDELEKAGLKLPPIPAPLQEKIQQINTSCRRHAAQSDRCVPADQVDTLPKRCWRWPTGQRGPGRQGVGGFRQSPGRVAGY